jgi:chloramphenicol 3-O phosphotransferase
LFGAYRRTAALWARLGFDVIVDDVCFDDDAAEDWDAALQGLPAVWVAVRCDAAVVEARERARGDRLLGLARGLGPVVDRRPHYDLELDTSSIDVEALAAALEDALTRRR